MAAKRKPKFRVGQVVRCSSHGLVSVISVLSDTDVRTGCSNARGNAIEYIRPLTAREIGPRKALRHPNVPDSELAQELANLQRRWQAEARLEQHRKDCFLCKWPDQARMRGTPCETLPELERELAEANHE